MLTNVPQRVLEWVLGVLKGTAGGAAKGAMVFRLTARMSARADRCLRIGPVPMHAKEPVVVGEGGGGEWSMSTQRGGAARTADARQGF